MAILVFLLIAGSRSHKHHHNGIGGQGRWISVILHQFVDIHLLHILGHYPAVCKQRSLHPPLFPPTRVCHTNTCICWHGASLLFVHFHWICHVKIQQEESMTAMFPQLFVSFFSLEPYSHRLTLRYCLVSWIGVESITHNISRMLKGVVISECFIDRYDDSL